MAYDVLMEPMKRKAFLKMMKEDGWVLDRTDGPHDVYELNGVSFPVPRHTLVSVGVVRTYHNTMKEMKK